MQKVHDPSKNSKWVDYPNIESPIIADELNRHEIELDTIDSRVVVHETTKANQVDLLTCVASITLNTTTGILTITLKNGSSTTIDTGLSKLAVNFDYDADPESEHYQQLILVMKDGSKQYIDLSALITQFEFKNSATITWTVGNDGSVTANIINGSITEEMLETNFLANCRLEVSKALGFSQDAEAWAKGTKGGTPVASTDEHYHNNAKYYSEVAHTEADNATTKAQDSEAWAVGKRNGQDVPSTDETYHNNAKYWAEQAEGAVTGNDKVTWEANGVLGAKNLIPYPYYETTKTVNGITFTDNGDGTITVNGTATATADYIFVSIEGNTPFQRGNYFLSGCPLGESSTTYRLYYQPYSGGQWGIARIDEGNGVNVPIGDEKKCTLRIRVYSGATVSNLIFKPMLRLAEDTDDTYQPYAMTNKQLTDELKGKVDWVTNGKLGAKQLIPYPYYHTTRTINGITFTVNDDGTVTVSGTATGNNQFLVQGWTIENGSIPLEPTKQYILNGSPADSAEGTYCLNARIYPTGVTPSSSTGTVIRDLGEGVVIPKGYSYISIYIGVWNGTTVNNKVFKPMLRIAEDTDDTYQPYAMTNRELTLDKASQAEVDDIVNVYGAKNLIPYPYYSTQDLDSGVVFNGVTITAEPTNKNRFSFVGTSTGRIDCRIVHPYTNYLEKGTYRLTLKHISGSNKNVSVALEEAIGSTYSRTKARAGLSIGINEVSTIFTMTDEDVTNYNRALILYGNVNTTYDDVYEVALTCASIKDNTYVPYAKTNQQLTKDVNSKQNASDNSLNTTNKTVVGAINEVNTEVGTKQNASDGSLNTSNKTIVGAINEVNSSLANQISKLSSFLYVSSYSRTVTINALGSFINDDISNIIPSGKTPIGVVGTVIPTQSLANNLATLSCAVVYDNGYKLRWMLSNNSGSAVTTTVTAYILCAG